MNVFLSIVFVFAVVGLVHAIVVGRQQVARILDAGCEVGGAIGLTVYYNWRRVIGILMLALVLIGFLVSIFVFNGTPYRGFFFWVLLVILGYFIFRELRQKSP